MEVAIPARARLAHHLPGRFRLRFRNGAEAEGWALALAAADHPDVRSVRWGDASRSLTVEHDPAVPAERILAESRRASVQHAPLPPRVALRPLLGALVLATVPGSVQLVLTVAGLLLGGSTVPVRASTTPSGRDQRPAARSLPMAPCLESEP